MTTLLRDVEVGGRRADVRIAAGRIEAVGVGLGPRTGDVVVEGAGGWLLPGLHDHHLHLLALAAAVRSVDVSGCRGPADLRTALKTAPGTGWVRARGYHEAIAGDLDRHALDALVTSRPLRVQHRNGALWVLNSRAIAEVSAYLDASDDVERDSVGVPNGRLWRFDARLRRGIGPDLPALGPVGAELASLGITSVTDATPEMDEAALRHLGAARERGELPQHITVLADVVPAITDVTVGPRKLLLRDHDLPTFDELAGRVGAARAQDRSVAVHCVTRESLLLTLAVLDQVGRRAGDRIEHAAVVVDPGALHGLIVVTQPAFVTTRGDDYLHDVHPDDLPHLYPFAGLLRAGVRTWASSDAPFGPLDPWQVMRAARDRRTPTGQVVGAGERVPVREALHGYLTDSAGTPRRVRPGAAADLVLMAAGSRAVLDEPDARHVRGTWIAGERVH